jgi:hypothetical protein
LPDYFSGKFFMKKFSVIVLSILFVGCKKEINQPAPVPSPPNMMYTDLGNLAVRFGQHKSINLNGDNTLDLLFSTMLVGDPVLRRDRRQYFVNADFDVFLLTNPQEQTPGLSKGTLIETADHAGYNWFNASSIVLTEKIVEESGPAYWEGNWKNADHKNLPVQIRKNNLRYNGWVEASFNMNTEELILHRAAIATEAGKTVLAGY